MTESNSVSGTVDSAHCGGWPETRTPIIDWPEFITAANSDSGNDEGAFVADIYGGGNARKSAQISDISDPNFQNTALDDTHGRISNIRNAHPADFGSRR